MPRFPYPPTVNTDLRDLFRLDRQNRMARDLGASSITRGEGSLDLYDTDDGPVTHRYGDLPDGSFGVGITHRGGFWNVSDLIGAGEDRDDGQDGRMDGHASRLGAAEGRLDAHAGRLGAAEGRLDGHATRLGTAEGRLNDHAGRIGATESKNTAQDSRLDSHVSRIGAAENAIADAVSRLDAHAQRIGASEGDIAALDGALEDLAEVVQITRARVLALEQWRGNLVNMSQRLRAIDGGPEFDFPLMP